MREIIYFFTLLSAGLISAATIGKFVPHIQWLVQSFGISLGEAGLIISGAMIPGALVGTALGALTDRYGSKTVGMLGLLLHSIASIFVIFANSFWLLLALRFIEGLGYTLFIVSTTVLIIELTSKRHQILALSVWSAFAPIGFALGQWASSYVGGEQRLVTIGTTHAALLAVSLTIIFFLIPSQTKSRTRTQFFSFVGFRYPPAFRTAISFGLVTGVLLAAVALAPLILAPIGSISVREAAQFTALAALPGIVGRFGSGWLLASGIEARNLFAVSGFIGIGCLLTSLQFPITFYIGLIFFSLFQIATGFLPGILSALIPDVSPSPEDLGSVSGVINQMVSIGNLIGPPLVLSVFAVGGSLAANGILLLSILLAMALVLGLTAFRHSH